MIRKAQQEDKDAIVKIWRKNTAMLGGVQVGGLKRSIENGLVHVAERNGEILGFVEFYSRRDGWQTIYHIATSENARKQGVGAALLWSVPCPIRLNVTADNENAIRFYEHHHMIKTGEKEAESGRRLCTYELRTLFIQVAGNNTKWPEICRKAGIAYGSRHDDQIRAWPTMIDINWEKYDWNKYLEIIKTHKPIMAMVADYERPDQKELMLRQVQDLRDLGVLRIMVCPKFDGAIADIPSDCIIAVSVPSRYAGYLPLLIHLKGKKVHLLGGSPKKQQDYLSKIHGLGGIVVSMDGNSHAVADGRIWQNGQWMKNNTHTSPYENAQMSAVNIARMMQHGAEAKQKNLFEHSVSLAPKRKSTRSFETEKRMEIKQTGYARMTVSDDEYLELPLESGILNMHGWRITAMDEGKGEYNIYAEPTGNDYEKIGCFDCGTMGQWYKHGTRTMRIVDLPVHGKQTVIIVERQRWRCKACSSTVQEDLPYVHQTRSMTERVLAYIELKALESTFAEVSREIGVSESTVSNIFQDFIARLEERRKLETPRVLGIDEVYIGKQSRAVFTDIDKRVPIDMLPTRTKAEVKKWLATLDTQKVEVVIMDMWNPYRDAVKDVIPHAVIVVDKFHVVRMANDALNRVRKNIRANLRPNQRVQLKRDRYVMLRRRDQLDAKDTFLLETWLGSFEELGHAYAAKEMFCDIWESDNPQQAQAKYREWLLWIADKKLQGAFADLVRAMTNWHDEIFAHFKHRYTNAYTEAMNGILKIINRKGRGYGFKALRAKVIYSALRREEDNAEPEVTTYDDLIDGDYQAAWFAIYGEDLDDDDSTSVYHQLPFDWR